MRIGTIIVVVWLLIGLGAAAQRGYLKNSPSNCSHATDVALTILAGPLNYVGVNPKTTCKVPQPSK